MVKSWLVYGTIPAGTETVCGKSCQLLVEEACDSIQATFTFQSAV
jgi:hypothetical protein